MTTLTPGELRLKGRVILTDTCGRARNMGFGRRRLITIRTGTAQVPIALCTDPNQARAGWINVDRDGRGLAP